MENNYNILTVKYNQIDENYKFLYTDLKDNASQVIFLFSFIKLILLLISFI